MTIHKDVASVIKCVRTSLSKHSLTVFVLFVLLFTYFGFYASRCLTSLITQELLVKLLKPELKNKMLLNHDDLIK